MLKVLSLFSGIGSFEKALRRQGIEHEIVNFCEFEPKIAKSYSLIHNVDISKNLGDISKVDPNQIKSDIDLMTYGFPCTDVSIAKSNGAGLKGEESGLLYEAIRIAEEVKPKYMVAENVDNLVTKHTDGFNDLLERLFDLGYTNYWSILKASEYGVPQSRKRVFIVSIRNDVHTGFSFPRPINLPKSWWEYIDLYDMREITPRQRKMIDISQGLIEEQIKIEGTVNFDRTVISLRTSGLRFQSNREFPTIVRHYGTGGGNFPMLAMNGELLGGITPRNCFKLMGFDYEDCSILIENKIPNNLLYIMAGNSIVVNVLEQIFINLLGGMYNGN
jgi:DNA (cytosine-5)-methyltransferase 1